MVKRLEKKGIKCCEFNSFKSALDSRYNNRDHRKICVIDGSVGFTGGFNLADEYINQKTVYGHWKDTAIMIKGDGVWSLTSMFLALWDSSKKEKDDYQRYVPSEKFTYNDGFVAPYTDYPLDDEPVGKNVYLNIINRASKYVYIMTPYLVPDTVLVSALENAAKNGIDVRIIMPGIPDKKIVYMLSQSFYPVLLKAGVKIYEYTPGFVHAKVFLSDDELAVVGTINIDYRSLAHHFEDAVWMYKTFAVSEIKKDFMETFAKSKEVPKEGKKESVLRRILMPILRLFAPLF
jgi:cardiolipin synthase